MQKKIEWEQEKIVGFSKSGIPIRENITRQATINGCSESDLCIRESNFRQSVSVNVVNTNGILGFLMNYKRK